MLFRSLAVAALAALGSIGCACSRKREAKPAVMPVGLADVSATGSGTATAAGSLDAALADARAPLGTNGTPAQPTGVAAPAGCKLAALPWRFPAVPRVIAFGDVHGDLAAARRALILGGVLDAEDHWKGGTTWVVQTGDVLDRGDDEQAIVDLFERLEGEASAAGGRFIWLLGNHELMNAAGDLRYVTRGGFHDFEDVAGLGALDRFADAPEPARARIAAFAPGGPYARILSNQTVVVVVGDTAFVHGGIIPGVAATLDADQLATRCWLDGTGPSSSILERSDGPVWDRTVAGTDVDCGRLDRALAELRVSRLVVGHTPQPSGITSACTDKVWRIDVGLAAYYGGPTEVLELTGATARAIR